MVIANNQQMVIDNNKQVTFCWVLSHVGVRRNAMVDVGARDAN